MIKTILISIFLFIGISAFSQTECNDIIYTIAGNKIIFNCCIQEVVNRNTVVYIKDGKEHKVAAYAITKDDRYIELIKDESREPEAVVPVSPEQVENGKYKGHTYAYYQQKFIGARTRQGFGMFFTFLGVGLEIAGLIKGNDSHATQEDVNKAAVYILAGSLLENLGIPLWISGGIKKANNRKAMETIKKSQELSFGMNNYGVGLTFRF